jgi:hypothetical protein
MKYDLTFLWSKRDIKWVSTKNLTVDLNKKFYENCVFENWNFEEKFFITKSQLPLWNWSLKAGVWQFADEDGVEKRFSDKVLLKIDIFYKLDFDSGRFLFNGTAY